MVANLSKIPYLFLFVFHMPQEFLLLSFYKSLAFVII